MTNSPQPDPNINEPNAAASAQAAQSNPLSPLTTAQPDPKGRLKGNSEEAQALSNQVGALTLALRLVEQAYAERTDESNPWHGGALYGKERTAWLKVIANLKNLAGDHHE